MKVELLAPAGGERSADAALNAGADAIYLGTKQFSARDGAENFDAEALRRFIVRARLLGVKVYVCLNTLVKDSELDEFFSSLRAVWEAGADAVLMQDLFLGREVKKRYPDVVLHLSTQAGCCNVYGAEVAKDFGFSRVVLARETPLADMAMISKVIETEVFVQGALCSAFSGQCYLSSFAGNNSGNRGRCKQPCRKRYRIDRAGYDRFAYALSTSDLCVGRRLGEYLDAGVSSLKIEGRMRRPEYVGAAVSYYRALLDGKPADEAFCSLRRAYNRGDYTCGLAFGQEKDFLSRNVQGHIGEPIGEVSFEHGTPVCHTSYQAQAGDGFKILRCGREVGGAVFAERRKGGFALSSREELAKGDEVRLTTCAFPELPARLRPLEIRLFFRKGEVPRAEAEGTVCCGKTPLEAARSAPLSAEEIAANFQKTDGAPFSVRCTVQTDGVFLPKAALNAFRREFYTALVREICPKRPPMSEVGRTEAKIVPAAGRLTAAIGEECGDEDLLIYKPHDYAKLARPAGKRVYLYLPPFWTAADEELVRGGISSFDGIYCEGYYGMALAERYRKPLFAGVGFNLTNRYAVCGVRERAEYFVLSKEISSAEQAALSAEGAFTLAGGDIKVMDLVYCPFGRECSACDKRDLYRLTDEDGREFPLRRYRAAGMACRFEVYNCAALAEGDCPGSRLFDRSAQVRSREKTAGHRDRSML